MPVRSHASAPLPPHIAAMSRPDFYPHRPAEVSLVQTHISYVFLAGDEVFKVKKPVRFSFLDFSTPERRHHFCREEVRLNRRLAPDVYLGVVSICPGFRLGDEDDAAAIDYAVRMRRLPEDRFLVRLLDRGEVTVQMIDDVADRLVRFHRDSDAGPEVRALGDPAVFARSMEADFEEVTRFRDVTITHADDVAIGDFCRASLRRFDALLRRRRQEGRVRDGHGDLHAEHICFGERGLIVFDCIEFNPEFRCRDVAAEIAFLAMDLEYRERADLARRLVDRYAAAAEDPDLPRLVPFYQCHRAYIRGKVDSLKSAEPEVDDDERERARRSAAKHFALAYRYTWAYRPTLVVVAGLSGSGKTTIARALAERTGFVHVNSDVVRKRLAGVPDDRRSSDEEQARLYTPELSARTYEAMLAGAAESLAAGRGAIVDATFQRVADRGAARDVARRHEVPALVVECRCADGEVRRRLAARVRIGAGASDAGVSVYRQQKRTYEPVGADEPGEWLAVETSRGADAAVREIEAALRRQGGAETAAGSEDSPS